MSTVGDAGEPQPGRALEALFSPGGQPLEPDLAGELASMMRLHGLSAEDLFFKWESYCIKMDLETADVSLPAVRNLKQRLQDELERRNQQRPARTPAERRAPTATPKAAAAAADLFGLLDGLLPSTPASRPHRTPASGASGPRSKTADMSTPTTSSPVMARAPLQPKDANSSKSFSQRPSAGEVLEVLNERLPPAGAPAGPYPEPRIKLTAASDQKKMAYRPLAMQLSEASEMLDDRIDEFAALVQQHHQLEDSAFGSAAVQATSQVVAVGRIASDSPDGKLNPASLVLEMSRRSGMGLRVPLKMDQVASWALFPGQIVALRGTNATGRDFVVSQLLEMPLLPGAASSQAALGVHRGRLRGAASATEGEPAPLTILFAAGPYSADDNLDFEPLQALCARAAESQADALVLAGPFIDVDHPLVAAGDVDLPDDAVYDPDTATLTTLFRFLFAPALSRLAAANPHLSIILLPSVRDLLSKHVSWPQEALSRKELGLPKCARLVSNPVMLSMNEILLGLSSQDILYQLRAEELASGPQPGDLMARLCRHLLEQRHYFPLFPPTPPTMLPRTGTDDGLATGAVLDLGYLRLGEMLNVRPDVLLTPSALPPFAKVVESVLAINPGRLSKRKGPGTYARMTVYPPADEGEARGEAMVSHRIYDRARVEIVRV